MDNIKKFGLFSSPAFPNRTLRIHNGVATLIDTEEIMKEHDIHTPEDVWKALEQTIGTPCPESVFDSDSWISRVSAKSIYKMTYGLPDDYDIITDHKAMVSAERGKRG